jgi:hypothetical protein
MATLTDVFRAPNSLEDDGVLQKYAIAGAMAFLFYTEPARTYDLDVFVFLPPQDSIIFSMEPLYQELRGRGYAFDAEHVLIHETPVQCIPAYNALAEEAVEQAVMHDYDDVPVRVISPEYLVALVFQTGGRHRLIRAAALLAEGGVNENRLDAILSKHGVRRKGQG